MMGRRPHKAILMGRRPHEAILMGCCPHLEILSSYRPSHRYYLLKIHGMKGLKPRS